MIFIAHLAVFGRLKVGYTYCHVKYAGYSYHSFCKLSVKDVAEKTTDTPAHLLCHLLFVLL